MFDIKGMFKPKERLKIFSTGDVPKHIAITTDGTIRHTKENGLNINEMFDKFFKNIKEITETAVDKKVPVISFYLSNISKKKLDTVSLKIDFINKFFSELLDWEYIHKNQIKISVLGRWYDLPAKVIDNIKDMIVKTKDYDAYFLNFFVNYDGKEEIVDACKLIIRQAVQDRLDPESITDVIIKDNLYTSYFIPPELFIKTGYYPKTKSFLLWDSGNAIFYNVEKPWVEFSKKDLNLAIDYYNHYRKNDHVKIN